MLTVPIGEIAAVGGARIGIGAVFGSGDARPATIAFVAYGAPVAVFARNAGSGVRTHLANAAHASFRTVARVAVVTVGIHGTTANARTVPTSTGIAVFAACTSAAIIARRTVRLIGFLAAIAFGLVGIQHAGTCFA